MIRRADIGNIVWFCLFVMAALFAYGLAVHSTVNAASCINYGTWCIKNETNDTGANYFLSPDIIPQHDVQNIVNNDFTRMAGCVSRGSCKQDLITSINNAGSFTGLYTQVMFGKSPSGAWQQAINGSDVSVSTTTYPTSINSGWSPGANAVIFAREHPGDEIRNASAVLITYGAQKYVIKQDCGNFLNIPGKQPITPTGQFTSITCTWNGTNDVFDINVKWFGGDRAFITGNTGQNEYGTTRTNEAGDSWSIIRGSPASGRGGRYDSGTYDPYIGGITTGAWPLELWVSDGAGTTTADYVLVDTAVNITKPCGHFKSVTCSGDKFTIVATWLDVDASTPTDANAYLKGANGVQYQTKYSSDGTWTYTRGTGLPDSAWPIQLLVQNSTTSTFVQKDTNTKPNCKPTGDLKVTCNYNGGSPIYKFTATYEDSDGNSSTPAKARIVTSSGSVLASDTSPSPYDGRTFTYSTAAGTTWTTISGSSSGIMYLDALDVGPGTWATHIDSATKPSCGDVVCSTPDGATAISLPEGYTGYNLTVSAHLNGISSLAGPWAGFTLTVKDSSGVTIPPSTGTGGLATASATSANGGVDVKSVNISSLPSAIGTYDIYWGWTGSNPAGGTNYTTPATCHVQLLVGYAPYFQVGGGDTVAGNEFSTSGGCALDSSADLKSWNYDNVGTFTGYYGAGSQLGALAGGKILGFISNHDLRSSQRGLNAYYSPVGGVTPGTSLAGASTLSFRNDSGVAAGASGIPGNYGGSFNIANSPVKSVGCMPDYFNGLPALENANPPQVIDKTGTTSVTDLNSYASGNYEFNNDLTIASTTALGNSKHVTFYVRGVVYIDSDVLYQAYAQPSLVPNFTLHVSGSIYVNGAVHELHGLYSAQDDASGVVTAPNITHDGTFATCYYSNAGIPTETTLWGRCNTAGPASVSANLEVYGTVEAEHLHLNRSHDVTGGASSLYHATATGPAELFQYGPESWLNSLGNGVCSGSCSYDSITSLPPVL